MSQEEFQPHDSAYVHSSRKGRHWYKVFPSLREKDRSRGQWVLLVVLVLFAVFGGSFLGFVINTSVPPPLGNPPVNVIGLCPPPAYISGSGCFQLISQTDAQGNTKNVVEPAGSLLSSNGTIGNGATIGAGK